jgi:tetrapyrrole methylase family protein/MazG family protein
MQKWELTTASGEHIAFGNLPGDASAESLLTVSGRIFDGKYHLPFSAALPALIFTPFCAVGAAQLQQLLLSEYAAQETLYASTDGFSWQAFAAGELAAHAESVAFLFLPGRGSETTLEGFQEIIAHLRAPEGCPWDRKQTHASLRTYLLEETYEALDALDRADLSALQEELGDLLLQIALHAQIAQENSEFRLADVLTGIHRKIVFRHPHVFKDWVVDGEEQVLQNWEALKSQERQASDSDEEKGLLDGVPASYPALAQAQALQERAARVGFDWPEIAPVIDKIQEELEEIRTASTSEARSKEFGDLLFAIVNLLRWEKVDAETVLRQTNAKFRKRFAFIERSARAQNRQLQQMTLQEMDALWEQAKQYDD